MTRFGQLEFDDGQKKQAGSAGSSGEKKAGIGEPLRDSHYFYSQARLCWLAGDFELALRNYSRAVENDSTFFEGWYGQVMMLIELGEYPEATMWADKALKLFPEHAELLAAKAEAAACDARFEQAYAYSDQAIERENVTARVWLARARILLRKKNNIAMTCISNAVGLAGQELAVVRLQAGRLLREADRLHAALEHLDAAVRLLPKSALAWYELGACQARLGRAEAKTSLEQSLILRPKWRAAAQELENCRHRRGLFGRVLAGLFGGSR